MKTFPGIIRGLLTACLLLSPVIAQAAETPEDLAARQKLSATITAKAEDQPKLLDELGDTGSRTVSEVLNAWMRDGVYLFDAPDGSKVPVTLEEQADAQGKVRAVRVIDGQILKDEKGEEIHVVANDLTAADTDMALRKTIQKAIDSLALSDRDPDVRHSAVAKLGNSQKLIYLPILQARLTKEIVPDVRHAIAEAVSLLQLNDPDPKTQTDAIDRLAQLNAIGSLDTLKRFAAKEGLAPETKNTLAKAISSIEQHIWWVNFYGTIFHGISTGSILLVVALGLAITFGLMGIINMAHGEMIAVGAYTCYVVQNIFGAGFGFTIVLPFSIFSKPIQFGAHLPGLHSTGWVYQSYFLVALPLSFIMAALAGLFVERTVIRFLYRRPLESLLATWGVSLVMQQCFRMVFGANNVQVNSPSWLLGHFSVGDVSFGYNRIFVVCFAMLIVVGTWLLLAKTPLGLLIRAVMQNRNMAACLGVRTRRINMLTFSFGSGLAGLAGAFLSQIGNVGPSLGQTYIVDSFMTVVVGGVGSIVGTVCAAMGIGTSDQVLQQLTGSPVTGKIVVLITIILFLQWKPGGLFSTRSRSLD